MPPPVKYDSSHSPPSADHKAGHAAEKFGPESAVICEKSDDSQNKHQKGESIRYIKMPSVDEGRCYNQREEGAQDHGSEPGSPKETGQRK